MCTKRTTFQGQKFDTDSEWPSKLLSIGCIEIYMAATKAQFLLLRLLMAQEHSIKGSCMLPVETVP